MPTFVCMLRAINVTAHNRIKMRDLEDVFLGLGYTDPTTYVQSGNVAFKTRATKPATIAAAIEDALASRGIETTALLRTPDELGEVLAANPFPNADVATVHVTFLQMVPDPSRIAGLTAPSGCPDEFLIAGREVYLHCPDGYGRTKLNPAFWERKLGVPTTTRNWKSVTALEALGRSRA